MVMWSCGHQASFDMEWLVSSTIKIKKEPLVAVSLANNKTISNYCTPLRPREISTTSFMVFNGEGCATTHLDRISGEEKNVMKKGKKKKVCSPDLAGFELGTAR